MSIRVSPSTSFEATLELGITGLVGTLEVGIYEGSTDTATQTLSSSDINEIGASGVYVATRTAPGTAGQYVLIWSQDGTLNPDQVVTEDLTVSGFAGDGDSVSGDAYATTDELFRILKIRNPSDEQVNAAQRVLVAAAGEINTEIDRASDDAALSGWQVSLAAEVNLERAVEHWRQQEAPFGLLGVGGDLTPTFSARDSWERHALKLAPLKEQWGLA